MPFPAHRPASHGPGLAGLLAVLLLASTAPASAGSPAGDPPAPATSHWAFLPPRRPAIPEVRQRSWIRTPVDGFILSRLEREGLAPAAEAPAETLGRRLALALTGIPLTVEERARFLEEAERDREGAIGGLVDRLLQSPRYGEHMAARWLDMARYADSSGFQGDPGRTMWRWRDYVIEAFNANMPFDQFTLEQLAGDLLPNPTLRQQVATGFNRNHRFNTEFGSIDEEWKTEYVVDRLETTGATWLALTLGCGRCHDHKYDPVTQREFYQLFALFSHIPERGVFWDGSDPAFPPSVRAATPAQESRIRELGDSIREADEELRGQARALGGEQAAWERRSRHRFARELNSIEGRRAPPDPPRRFLQGLTNEVARFPFDRSIPPQYGVRSEWVTNRVQLTNQFADGSSTLFTQFYASNEVTRFSELLHAALPTPGELDDGGVFGQALRLPGDRPALAVTNALDRDRVTVAFWLNPDSSEGLLLHKLSAQALFPIGLLLSLTNGHPHLEIHHKVFEFDATMIPMEMTATNLVLRGRWTHLALVLDGKRREAGPRLYLDGVPVSWEPLKASARGLNTFSNAAPLLVGAGPRGGGIAGRMDDLRIFDRPLSPGEVRLLADLPDALSLSLPRSQRTPAGSEAAARFYSEHISLTAAAKRSVRDAASRALGELEQSIPQVMVFREEPGPPEARILFRGQYDSPREPVFGGIPVSLGRLPEGAPTNRLGFAQWVVSPDNPLTARVFVNRLWESLFGTGLVRTSENFGTQGEPPSHPELLDWMATELIRTGWDVKRMIRLLVTSAAYRQDSSIPSALLQRDPENRLLARGPRFRLPAEVIRDRALHAAGLLAEQVGGPSVQPYLPGDSARPGPEAHRRSLYSIWQRTRFNPSLATFDAPSREACTVKRPRTNTPLQALALMNELTYLEAAQSIAAGAVRSGGGDSSRLEAMFLRVLGRLPTRDELGALERLLGRSRERYRKAPGDAIKLVRHAGGEAQRPEPAVELAAHLAVASALLNLDEFVTLD
ncbi:MAG TPA: hypothetical protein DCM86_14375 [Verrucomicrobiales bacterium]|nr:hypothetical protein [Verrucomicrobiales bacterium]